MPLCNKVSLGSSDTVRSKDTVEYKALEYGLTVKSCRADNGIFTSTEFIDAMMDRRQKMSLICVGARDQNGVAEQAMQA